MTDSAYMMKNAEILIYGNKGILEALGSSYLLRNADKKVYWSVLICLCIKNCGLLKLITINQMLEDSRHLFYEYYQPLN